MSDVNNVCLVGSVDTDSLTFAFKISKTAFFNGEIQVRRKSGTCDAVKLIMRQRDKDRMSAFAADGSMIRVDGQIRQYSDIGEDGKSHMDIRVMVKAVTVAGVEDSATLNEVELTGLVFKRPEVRTTATGKTVTDFLVRVDLDYGRIAYVPVIAWDDQAVWSSENLNEMDAVHIKGRMQSRKYTKVRSGKSIEHTVREVSVYEIGKERSGGQK